MISVIVTDDGLVVDGEVPAGSAAVLDREWVLTDRSSATPAIVVEGDAAEGARALAAVAEAAVESAVGSEVAVVGAGFVAAEARRRLVAAGRLADTAASPESVIETTGDPDSVAAAAARVRDLGTVVLAGETLGRTYDLDLYTDAHVRGLHLLGRGRAGLAAEARAEAEGLDGVQSVKVGEPLDVSALWFCVAADGGA